MTTVIQRNFSGGVLSPGLQSRVDLVKYQSGLAKGKNVFIQRYGGASNRPGTRLIADLDKVFNASGKFRLIPFNRFGSMTRPVAVLGNKIAHIGGTNERGQFSSFLVGTPWSIDEVFDVKYVQSADVITLVHPNHPITELRWDGMDYSMVEAGFNPRISPPEGVRIARRPSGSGSEIHDYRITAVSKNGFEESFPSTTSARAGTSGNLGAGTARITVAWDAVEDAVEYNVYKSASGNYQLLGVATSASFDDVGQSTDSSVTPPSLAGLAEDYPFVLTITGITQADPAVVSYTAPDAFENAGATHAEILEGRLIRIDGVVGMTGLNGKAFRIGTVDQDAGTFTLSDAGRDPFDSASEDAYVSDGTATSIGDKPSVVTYYQQRLVVGAYDSNPERVRTSQIGRFQNFNSGRPPKADDSITFTMAGARVGRIQHLVDLERLIILTDNAEWTVSGDEAGILLPDAINLRKQSERGAADLAPVKIGKTALYLEGGGSIIRDLGYDYQVDGYTGNDLTLFSPHYFENHKIVDWAYQRTPHSIVWAVRDDGVLLSLTYLKEQQITAWCEHEIEGKVESVAVNNSGGLDVLYLSVLNPDGKRYLLLMEDRNPSVDGFLDYSGEVPGEEHECTLMVSAGGFKAGEPFTLTTAESVSTRLYRDGNGFRIVSPGGVSVDFTIQARTSRREFAVIPDKDVPQDMVVGTHTGKVLIKSFGGVDNFYAGKDLAIVGEGNVVANPLNSEYDIIQEDALGVVTLPRGYTSVKYGIPYLSDIETLDIEYPGDGTYAGKEINIQNVVLYVDRSRGMWVGGSEPSEDDPLDGLTEFRPGDDDDYDSPTELRTGKIDINIQSEWNSNGRIFIRQVDPLPMTVSAVAPSGLFPTGRD